jgi:glutathione S-transferase
MPVQRDITLFHAPNTRSFGTLLLLEELGAPYTLRVLNMPAGEQREAAYLAINPMGKVPAVLHGEALITEQVAIYLHLADLFPEAGLAPAPDDPLRGPYLRWMVFYAACFEPAIVDRALKREAGPPALSPYGSFDTMLETIRAQLARGTWLLGARFSAADVLWGAGLGYATQFGMVPPLPEIAAYSERCNDRPAVARTRGRDAELSAAQRK